MWVWVVGGVWWASVDMGAGARGVCETTCAVVSRRITRSTCVKRMGTWGRGGAGGGAPTMSCTPGCFSCMNSNSLLTTVRRNFQC